MHTARLQTNRPPEMIMQYPLHMTVAELSGNLKPCVQIFKQQHRYVQAYMRSGMDGAEFGDSDDNFDFADNASDDDDDDDPLN